MAYSLKENLMKEDRLSGGHRMCAGCGSPIAVRTVLRALDPEDKAVVCSATSCLEVSTFMYPYTAWKDSFIHNAFENAAATISGVETAYRAMKKRGKLDDTYKFIAFGGDGGTYDIGFQSLSGAMERGHDMVYVCYDNEAYMNTGVQRSSATPPAARTATTQIAGEEPGNAWGQGKNVPLIAMAHGIPYVATATVADLRDLERKVTKAMSIRGARYIHILVPCPLGWGSASGQTVQLARLAHQTGIFPVFEAEYGKVTGVQTIRRKEPVESYLKLQKRFAHLFGRNGDPEVLERIQAMADNNIEKFGLLDLDDETASVVPVPEQGEERAHTI